MLTVYQLDVCSLKSAVKHGYANSHEFAEVVRMWAATVIGAGV